MEIIYTIPLIIDPTHQECLMVLALYDVLPGTYQYKDVDTLTISHRKNILDYFECRPIGIELSNQLFEFYEK